MAQQRKERAIVASAPSSIGKTSMYLVNKKGRASCGQERRHVGGGAGEGRGGPGELCCHTCFMWRFGR